MIRYFKKMTEVHGDSTKQFQDLLVFIGYFTVALYACGYAYSMVYNRAFGFTVKPLSLDATTPVAFVENILLASNLWFWAATYLLAFSVVYYSCRYVWRPWFGYFVLALLLYSTFLGCTSLGSSRGTALGIADRTDDTSTLPKIKIFFQGEDQGEFGISKVYRLLAEDDEEFLVFNAPAAEGSQILVKSVTKSEIDHYELTL